MPKGVDDWLKLLVEAKIKQPPMRIFMEKYAGDMVF
jgi:hypothetical protein